MLALYIAELVTFLNDGVVHSRVNSRDWMMVLYIAELTHMTEWQIGTELTHTYWTTDWYSWKLTHMTEFEGGTQLTHMDEWKLYTVSSHDWMKGWYILLTHMTEWKSDTWLTHVTEWKSSISLTHSLGPRTSLKIWISLLLPVGETFNSHDWMIKVVQFTHGTEWRCGTLAHVATQRGHGACGHSSCNLCNRKVLG